MIIRTGMRLALICAPAVVGAAIAVALRYHPTADRVAVLATGSYAVAAVVAGIRGSLSGQRPVPRPYRGEQVEPMAQLARVERSVGLSRASRLEYEHRLQPDLRRATAERLRMRRGIDLDRDPEAARGVLGDRAWEMVALRKGYDDRQAPAPTLAEIAALIETLEQV